VASGERPIAALILAGGESRRMGRPKALLTYQGRSFLSCGVETLRAAGCAPVIVVDGAHRLAPPEHAVLVHNDRWELGPLSSLQVGLRRALERHESLAGVLVHPVERPRVRVETIQALLEAFEDQPECVWQPSFEGRSGHPILWPRSLGPALLTLDPRRDTARTLLRGSAAPRRRRLELDDPGVLDNFDTPADLLDL
jgi:molybdenum cofactor cytidylyltransferase